MPIRSLNGLRYHVAEHGTGLEAILLLHGFTGSSASWAPVVDRLAERYRVLAPDLIGHGATEAPQDVSRYRIDRAADDLIALLDELGLPTVHWVGYSMGARLALHAALRHPSRVNTLTLESGSPGLASLAERETRVAADSALADRIERDGIEAFVAHWEALPLFASQVVLSVETRAALHTARLRNDPRGLAHSLRGMGTGAQPSNWEALAAFQRPAHLIVGALDAKFVAIAEQMQARLPNARRTIVPDAGHTIHVEQPAAWCEAVLAGLSNESLSPPPTPRPSRTATRRTPLSRRAASRRVGPHP